MAIEWDVYKKIRQLYLVEKQSMRAIARILGVDRKTVRKYCRGGVLPDVRKATERKPVLLDAVKDEILRLLEENKSLPTKQRLNAKDIWECLLREKGIAVAQSTIRNYVRLLKEHHPEVFIPLDHEPGESIQFDWGDMVAVIAGVKTSVSVFCAALPHSGAIFAFVYPNKSTISFLHGHIQTFESIRGVARRCVYDNLRTAVLKGSGKNAVKQISFKRLEAHYGFDAVFCNVASGWEKSNVENAVAIIRRIAFTPMPRVESYAQLQEHVSNCCLHYLKTHAIQGREHSINELFQKEREALLPLPEAALDMGFTTIALVQPDLTVHHEGTKYSVPHTLAGKMVTLRLTPFHLSIFHEGKEIYVHDRALNKNDHRYVLEHYLDILERKPRAIPQARPLSRGIMPEECSEFLRLCCEPEAKEQLVEILLMGREVEKDKLLWALRQANHTKNPNFSLVMFFLDAGKYSCPADDLKIQHQSLSIYDELLKGETT